MTDSHDNRPWYRQFWPWFIMALPAAAVVAGLTMVTIAVKNQDSVVRDDWYKDGKAINLDRAREERAAQLGLRADMHFDALTGEVFLRLQAPADLPRPATLSLLFAHVTLAERDQTLLLRQQADGRYSAQLQQALSGDFDIELKAADWRLLQEAHFPRADLQLGRQP